VSNLGQGVRTYGRVSKFRAGCPNLGVRTWVSELRCPNIAWGVELRARCQNLWQGKAGCPNLEQGCLKLGSGVRT
jgi:hypothetical protein